jgi:hypothetical protein
MEREFHTRISGIWCIAALSFLISNFSSTYTWLYSFANSILTIFQTLNYSYWVFVVLNVIGMWIIIKNISFEIGCKVRYNR